MAIKKTSEVKIDLFKPLFCSSNFSSSSFICWSFAVKEYGKAKINPPKSLAGGTPTAWGAGIASIANLTPLNTLPNIKKAAANAVFTVTILNI